MNIAVSTMALALGMFLASAPAQAARLWSAGRLDKLAPERRMWFLRGYRLLGVMLSLAGLLLALETIPAL